MPGPSPKPDGERRRRNQPTFDWVLLPESGRKGSAPKLPAKTPDQRAWSKATRDWWAALWRKPQATQWSADDDELFRLAALREKFWKGGATGQELNAMLAIEDRHGLNDKALIQLRWRIVPDDATAAEVEKPKRAAASRRRALRVVS